MAVDCLDHQAPTTPLGDRKKPDPPLPSGTFHVSLRKEARKFSIPNVEEVTAMTTHKIYLNPTPVRIWHWLHALGIVTLILSGLQIRFPEYVNLFGTYKSAIRLHNTAGIVVALSFVLWFGYYALIAGSLAKLYIPGKHDIQRGLWLQGVYYFFNFFRGRPNPHHATPENKFNALQKSAYMVIMLMLVPLVTLTGLALLYIAPAWSLVNMVGGLKILVNLHFLCACALCAFVFTHVYLATLGVTPWAHFKPMWDGWEEIEEKH